MDINIIWSIGISIIGSIATIFLNLGIYKTKFEAIEKNVAEYAQVKEELTKILVRLEYIGKDIEFIKMENRSMKQEIQGAFKAISEIN